MAIRSLEFVLSYQLSLLLLLLMLLRLNLLRNRKGLTRFGGLIVAGHCANGGISVTFGGTDTRWQQVFETMLVCRSASDGTREFVAFWNG